MARIELKDNCQDLVVKMSEGNLGAMGVCMELMAKEKTIDKDSAMPGLGSLLRLDAYEIYGADIYMLYKDVCCEDIEKTIAVLRSCQLGFTPLADLKHAIAHYGDGLELDEIVEQGKERLPNFGVDGGDL